MANFRTYTVHGGTFDGVWYGAAEVDAELAALRAQLTEREQEIATFREAWYAAERALTAQAAYASGLEATLSTLSAERDKVAELLMKATGALAAHDLAANVDAPDERLAAIAERAMLAVSDPHLSAEAYRAALREVCTLALAEITRLKGETSNG